jgi:hypothetical protein
MMILENKLKSVYDKLSNLILQLRKICVDNINNIPTQINKMVIGQDKLKIHIQNSVAYEINEDDLQYLTTIRSYAFYGRVGLTNVNIPDNITAINLGAFRECTSLTSVTIPDSVTSIGDSAFGYCDSLTSVILGRGLQTINDYAFVSCNLTDMYLYPTTPPTLKGTYAIDTYAPPTIHVPIGSGDAYKTATNWSSFADKIVEDIEI